MVCCRISQSSKVNCEINDEVSDCWDIKGRWFPGVCFIEPKDQESAMFIYVYVYTPWDLCFIETLMAGE